MAKNNTQAMPKFASLDELVEYFDTHDLGEHLENMPEVYFDVDIQERRHLFTLDEDLAAELAKIASIEKIPSEVLINSWLREKIAHLHIA